MSLRDFLNWFEGFSENIDGAPTEKQWERIKGRLLALKEAPAEIGVATGVSSSEPVGGAGTTVWWKGKVKEALMDNDVTCLDPETADDVLRKIPIDLNADPLEVALRAVLAAVPDDD